MVGGARGGVGGWCLSLAPGLLGGAGAGWACNILARA
jgi:hypothetical protein